MGLLQLGFGEICRKFRRVMLSRKIKAAAGVQANALRTLGKRAAESGATGSASTELMAALAETQAKGEQLGSRLSLLDEKIRNLEAQREADAERFKGMDQAVSARKAPLDEELSTHQKTVAHTQRVREDIQRQQEKLQQERRALEESLRKPAAAKADAAADRARAEARLAALLAEQPQFEAQKASLAEASALAASAIERLKAAITPLQADLDRITAERNAAADSVKQALADLRKESGQVRAEADDVSRRRDQHHEALGAALVAAGAADAPALAAEMEAVATASESQAALQRQYDSSLADSSRMPKQTMLKFSALMLAAFGALAAGGYAVNQAMLSATPPASLAEDCRDPSAPRKPLKAHAGGPYSVVRGGEVNLDGSKSKGSCLKYKWTFAPAPPDPSEKPHPHTGDSDDDKIYAIVEKLACPEGQKGNDGASKTGAIAKTTFLCSLTVTLTVSDGQSSDRATAVVQVKPRGPKGWETKIDKEQPIAYLPDSKLVNGYLEFGKNLCAIDSLSHGLHEFETSKSSGGGGYVLGTVTDPNGPFDSWRYIRSSNLRLARSVHLNEDLKEGSELDKWNAAKGYKDFDTLQQAVIDHERLHGTIIFEKMQMIKTEGHDPAKVIETLSAPAARESDLILYANMTIRQTNGHLLPGHDSVEYIENHKQLKEKLRKNKDYNREGKILVRDGAGGTVPYAIPNIADVGDDGG